MPKTKSVLLAFLYEAGVKSDVWNGLGTFQVLVSASFVPRIVTYNLLVRIYLVY